MSFLVKGLPDITTDFSKWKIFFCDERLVPIDNPDSTFGLYKKQLIDAQVVNLSEDQFVTAKQNVTGTVKHFLHNIKNKKQILM